VNKPGPKNVNKHSVTQELVASRTEDNLAPGEIAFRDAFVQEYLVDFRGDLALSRIGVQGYSPARLRVRAYQLLREPYIAKEVSRRVREIRPQDVVRRGQVMSKLWEEANDTNNEGGTRVSATAHIAKMLGMDKDTTAPNYMGGVMMVPVTSLSEWEEMAASSQAALKLQVRNAV
jgi:hypothetical protein